MDHGTAKKLLDDTIAVIESAQREFDRLPENRQEELRREIKRAEDRGSFVMAGGPVEAG